VRSGNGHWFSIKREIKILWNATITENHDFCFVRIKWHKPISGPYIHFIQIMSNNIFQLHCVPIWNKPVNLACCSSTNTNFMKLNLSVDIFNINCNVIRTSTPYLYYKFIVKCYYNKFLVSKKWLKIIVLELHNKCIVQ
jgi:hypothetical protein